MALADILQVISSQKQEQISEMKSVNEEEIKKLFEEAETTGQEYSTRRFEEFEKVKESKEKKLDSDISRKKRMEISRVQKQIMDRAYKGVETKLSSLSKEEIIAFCSGLIRSIPATEGSLRSVGTDDEILLAAIKSAGKDFSVEKGGNGNGGFYFIGDGYTVDFTFHSLIQKDLREKCEADLFQELF